MRETWDIWFFDGFECFEGGIERPGGGGEISSLA